MGRYYGEQWGVISGGMENPWGSDYCQYCCVQFVLTIKNVGRGFSKSETVKEQETGKGCSGDSWWLATRESLGQNERTKQLSIEDVEGRMATSSNIQSDCMCEPQSSLHRFDGVLETNSCRHGKRWKATDRYLPQKWDVCTRILFQNVMNIHKMSLQMIGSLEVLITNRARKVPLVAMCFLMSQEIFRRWKGFITRLASVWFWLQFCPVCLHVASNQFVS